MVEKTHIDAPTTIVVFGATGDLNKRKLIPAFLDLFARGLLPKEFSIVGFSRKDISNDEYRSFIKSVVDEKGHEHSDKLVEDFLLHIYYIKGDFTNPKAYQQISEFLYTHDSEHGVCSNKLFYLAVPPDFYDVIFQNLADSGLSIPCSDQIGWTRIVVEKPFGRDLETAQALDKKLSLLFKENQIFRIDHYLVKETLENILAFRFSNNVFTPAWNNKFIEKVHIKLFEDMGVEGRGSFYDGVGALRDIGQNHILQMLALVSMEDPNELSSVSVREAREEVFKSLKRMSARECNERTVKGQYAGYLQEDGVKDNSKTETYFKITAFLKNKRWKGVPFVLEGGKKLAQKKTEITIFFKSDETCVCKLGSEHESHQNVLTFLIQPEQGINIRFFAKKPGFTMELEEQELSFNYKEVDGTLPPDAYEKLFLHVFNGDQTLFASTKEVEYTWRFITPILKSWQDRDPDVYTDNTLPE